MEFIVTDKRRCTFSWVLCDLIMCYAGQSFNSCSVFCFCESKRDLEKKSNPLNYVLPAVSYVTYSCVNIGFVHFVLRDF